MCNVGEGLTERVFFFLAGKKGWELDRARLAWAWLDERRVSGGSGSWTPAAVVEVLDMVPPALFAPGSRQASSLDHREIIPGSVKGAQRQAS